MPEHTPGPWEAIEGRRDPEMGTAIYRVFGPEQDGIRPFVAKVCCNLSGVGIEGDRVRHNAQLIAEAPTLKAKLAECERERDALRKACAKAHTALNVPVHKDSPYWRNALALLKAALEAKA